MDNKKENVSKVNITGRKSGSFYLTVFVLQNYTTLTVSPENPICLCTLVKGEKGKQFHITFISLVCFPEINDSNWFEVEIPKPDAAVPASSSEALFTSIHAENP